MIHRTPTTITATIILQKLRLEAASCNGQTAGTDLPETGFRSFDSIGPNAVHAPKLAVTTPDNCISLRVSADCESNRFQY
jgi:hypothetical protein